MILTEQYRDQLIYLCTKILEFFVEMSDSTDKLKSNQDRGEDRDGDLHRLELIA